jgi:hypothetical protein
VQGRSSETLPMRFGILIIFREWQPHQLILYIEIRVMECALGRRTIPTTANRRGSRLSNDAPN